jgi:predicted CXXCH cytochrome family protein
MAKGLLRGGEGPAHCLSCHEDTKLRLVNSTVAHEPVLEDCTTCHQPHTSDSPRLLDAPIRDNCISCHPQVGDEIQLAKMPHGAVTDDRSCANCHDPHASNVDRLLIMRQTELCLTCHDKPIDAGGGRVVASVAADMRAPFLHGPVEAGDCGGCHDSHGGKHVNLLHQPFPDRFYAPFNLANYGLCFECHSPDLVTVEKTARLTGFRDGDVNLHYVHVHKDDKGRTCKACHAVHGSSQPMHLAEAVPFEGSQWPLPIRFEKLPSGGSCSPGCHEPMDYDRNRPAIERSPALSRSVR